MTIFLVQTILFIILLVLITMVSLSALKKIRDESVEKKREEAELRRRKAAISGKETLSKSARLKQQVLYNLDVIHMPMTVFLVMEVGVTVIGFFAGKLILTATGLSVALACIFALLPLVFISVRASWYKQNEAAMLEGCMVMITGAYRTNKDIIKSVQDNINKSQMPVAFKTFLSDVTFVDSSVERALRKVGASFSNPYFNEWIEVLIKSQHDSTMMDILPVIIDEMNEAKKAQNESSAAMKAVWREYALWVITVICVPLVLKINDEWYNALTNTLVGKGLVIALLICLANTLRAMVKISKPIDI